MNSRKLFASITLLLILSTPIDNISREEQVVTPEVSILDETPSPYTDRVVYLANKTVLINGLVGEKVVLQCNVFNMPRDARIFWRRESLVGEQITETINDGLMSRDMSRWKIGLGKQQDSIRLEIMSLDETYAGQYTCECQYTGSVEPARVRRILNVFAKPTIIQYHSSYDTDVTEGEKAVLSCDAEGIPTPVIYWRRTGGQSSIIRNYGAVKMGTNITFDQVQAEDAGEYVCFAENTMGLALWRVQLRVRHAPLMRIFPAAPMQKVGCNLRLVCAITANPPSLESSCSWSSSKTGTILPNTPQTKLQYLNAGLTRMLVLDLEPVQTEDIGTVFTCSAENALGQARLQVPIQASSTEVLLINGRRPCSGTMRCLAQSNVVLFTSTLIIGLLRIQSIV